MLVILGLALGVQGAGAFVLQLSSSCPLASNGSALAFGLSLLFNRGPLVCYAPAARSFEPCAPGPLQELAAQVASVLNGDAACRQRAESRHRACGQLGARFWGSTALRRVPAVPSLSPVPPHARVVPLTPARAGGPVLLRCHVWGFYPPEVTIAWLRNGDLVAPGGSDPLPPATPNGDWTYQTQAILEVIPEPGDTFTCAVQHSSLDRPLLQDWGLGLSSGLKLKVVAATLLMALGLSCFVAGAVRYCARPAAPGYTPLPGDTYPAGNLLSLVSCPHVPKGHLTPYATHCLPAPGSI
ncbi:HLA class II histocompatibility antigen, DM beta chain [Dryobates pubescens]|uniref:HLA class II histocompatibility antigen, DM beta chain n=1 Tax=Dryobates pubescens TaxID=118200 RepID=UPI0023B8A423|nr:HLA class II histocompatibility antigen, DM beta chain [Dryobates pubescens]